MKKQSLIIGGGLAALMIAGASTIIMADEVPFGPREEGAAGQGFMGRMPRPHFGFLRDKWADLTEEQQSALQAKFEELRTSHHAELAQFLGLSEEELQSRLDNGETMRDIIESTGKTWQDMEAFHEEHHQEMKQYLLDQGLLSEEEAQRFEDMRPRAGARHHRMMWQEGQDDGK